MNLMQIMAIGCALLPILASPIAYLLRHRSAALNDGFVSLICLMTLAAATFIAFASSEADGVQNVFALLCTVMFFMSSLANPAYFRGEPRTQRYRAFLLLTLGSTLGVFYAGDLLTLYVCFEAMSLASWVWVAHNETSASRRAADTYLAMAMLGGLVMLYGLLLLYNRFGTLSIAELKYMTAACEDKTDLLVPGLCLLVGFGVKAGMFPLHVWLPKAYPVAPAPASALLSSILTKAGIYGILITAVALLWGNATFATLLLVLGALTMVWGALMAIFSMDLKRTLACSSLSQIGFILVGAALLATGQETDLAAAGVITHAINHSLTKLILFLAAGVLYKQMHTLDLNALKGAGRYCGPLKLCFLIGAVSLAGVPGFGGYISKTLLHEAVVQQMHIQQGLLGSILPVVEKLFLFSGGLTAAYMAKLFIKIFMEKPDQSSRRIKLDAGSFIAIAPAALALVLMGITPSATYEKITTFTAAALASRPVQTSYFTPANLKGAAISLCIGALAYGFIVRYLLTDRKRGMYTSAPALLDMEDDIYRPALRGIMFVGSFIARLVYTCTEAVVWCTEMLLNMGNVNRIKPGKDHHFSHYSKQYVRVNPIINTLQFEFMLFGIGVIIIFACLLVHI